MESCVRVGVCVSLFLGSLIPSSRPAMSSTSPTVSAYLLCTFILNAVTLVFLFAMLLTICLSEDVKRNPIFINFIIVTVIYSALLFYSDVTMFSSSAEMEMVVLKQEQNALTLVASISLLHLLIHVFILMRSAFKKISPKALARIQVFLIITPYLFGILPLAELFLTTSKFTAGLNYFQAALSLIATGFDGTLLIQFYKYRRVLRHYELEPESILTKATLVRVTLLCFFRLIITLTGLLSDLWDLKAAHTTSSLILLQDVQFEKVFEFTLHIYPLITLCVFIQMDVLTIWFPCLRRNNTKYLEKDPMLRRAM